MLYRLLGKNWARAFSFGSCLLMYGVGLVYFLLINESIYQFLEFIFYHTGFTHFLTTSTIRELNFQNFSIQWQCILLAPLLSPLLFIKKMNFLVKIARIGAFSLYAYIIFIIYIFFDNLASGRVEENWNKEMHQFTWDIGTIVGNFALAFLIQNTITQIMSTNVKQENN